jgi:hypothetical protein
MTFLNAILAFGALAFTVPLVVHLLNRSRYRTVDWGAMIFLHEQQPSNSRKMEWKHLLLLIVRCLIPICLALAMARPFLSGSSILGIQEPIATVIILDDSLSMQAKLNGGATRWMTALQSVGEVLKLLPEGSESHLVLAGNPPKSVFESDINEKLETWRTSPSVTGPIDLVEATRKGLDWLANQSLTRRQLIYVSDFQSTDWSGNADTSDTLKRLTNEQIIPPVVSWLDVSGNRTSPDDKSSETEFRNYSLSEPVITPAWFAEQQLVSVLCNVHNHSRTTIDALNVSIQLDDKTIDSQKINIAPKGATRVSTRFAAPSQGWHVLKIKIEAVDDLELDNTRQLPFISQVRSQVLLVDGDLRSEPMQSQSDFLRIALSPFTFSRIAGADFFDTRVISIDKLRETTLEKVAAVALCNVPQVDFATSAKLREYVEKGGGLIAFLGNRVNSESWNQLPTVDQAGVRFFSLSPTIKSQSEAIPDNPKTIALESLEANFFKELSQTSRESIGAIVVNRTTAITSLPDFKPDRIASFANGEPWILRQTLGRGSMWVVATSCDTIDTNLPTRPVFVPLMQRLFHAVANSRPSIKKQIAGTPWAIPFATDTNDGLEKNDAAFKVKVPGLMEEEIRNPVWTETRQIGLYEASWDQESNLQTAYCWMEPSSNTTIENQESDISDLSKDEVLKLAEQSNAEYFDSSDDLQSRDQSTWQGREIGSWFWVAAIVFFIAETLIAQSFTVRRRAPSRSNELEPSKLAARGLG